MSRTQTAGPRGLLLIDKPQAITSHGAVARTRKWLGTRKVGHAGTLDPMATGLLVLGIGSGTRLLTHIVGADKTYTATIRLGSSTPSDDADTAPDRWADPAALKALSDTDIERAAAALTGTISQVPSAVSAIKVEGKRAYDLVRAGADVELRPRTVTVSRFDLGAPIRSEAWIDILAEVDCSSGTYIRALARDLGAALGVYGHLTQLRRTRVGPFDVAHAHALPSRDAVDAGLAAPPLMPLAAGAAAVLPSAEVDELTAVHLLQGRFVDLPAAGEGLCAVLWAGQLVGVAEPARGKCKLAVGMMTLSELEDLRGAPGEHAAGKTTR